MKFMHLAAIEVTSILTLIKNNTAPSFGYGREGEMAGLKVGANFLLDSQITLVNLLLARVAAPLLRHLFFVLEQTSHCHFAENKRLELDVVNFHQDRDAAELPSRFKVWSYRVWQRYALGCISPLSTLPVWCNGLGDLSLFGNI